MKKINVSIQKSTYLYVIITCTFGNCSTKTRLDWDAVGVQEEKAYKEYEVRREVYNLMVPTER